MSSKIHVNLCSLKILTARVSLKYTFTLYILISLMVVCVNYIVTQIHDWNYVYCIHIGLLVLQLEEQQIPIGPVKCARVGTVCRAF